ncbi:Glycosyltransferase involved in cell wall bisynthesis [Desulfonatronum thiosulfatophilum]|uniref:Glycosyltransferase involved in cell wall bisynthesis n=1 Tax=Desulfonatronum thiosulfatophilum TaxID=617002 RepID=A0A1G6BCH4_9BACT|nr:glycosyltransferase family 4 protein [Desulfonatronum thiosulfatophilum]SDB18310.1 Glycosyltransferase involved in cell wall bisynthesis [Desulfonatronum thiosulfatophilum]
MTADTIGGVWTYACELAKALEPFGVVVHLACMGQPLSEDQSQYAAKTANLRIHASSYKLEWMADPWEDVAEAGKWLNELEARLQPDIIHLNNYAHGSLEWNAPAVMVAHSCVFTWWRAVKSEDPPAEWHVYYDKVREGLRNADMVVGVSRVFLDDVAALYGPLRQTRMIHNGLDPQDYHIRKKQDMVFGMGRVWDEGKNLSALASMHGRVGWPIRIAGSTRLEEAEDGQNAAGVFMGRLDREKIREVLSETPIYVLPAKYEPFGLSALEAAFSGCALVLGDIPTLREIWGDAAIYFPPGDAERLEFHLKSLIGTPELLAHRQKLAVEKAQQYSADRMSASYIYAYQELIA